MNNIVGMQSQHISNYDYNSICGFEVETIEAPTRPLIHKMSRFLYINKEKGMLRLQGQDYILQPGTVVSILPWQTSDVFEVTEPIELYLLKYYFDGVNNIIKSFYNTSNDEISLTDNLTNTPVVQCDQLQNKVMKHLFLQIREELGGLGQDVLDQKFDLSNIYLVNKIVEVIIQFYRIGKVIHNLEAKPHKINNSEILQYIYNHLSEKLTLKRLSGIFFLSESAISHYIHSTTGLSFFDLINEMRIGKTVNFLLYTDLTMEELAEILGFVDGAHISKVFMSRIGMKANDYRKTYQKVNDIVKVKETKASFEIIDYIYRQYMDNLKPKDVADQFHLSVKQLNKTLLYQVERNFEDFLNYVRVNRASELLLSSEDTISDIAKAVGYNSAKTLTRNFLKFRLMTPGVFRETVSLQNEEV